MTDKDKEQNKIWTYHLYYIKNGKKLLLNFICDEKSKTSANVLLNNHSHGDQMLFVKNFPNVFQKSPKFKTSQYFVHFNITKLFSVQKESFLWNCIY
jgi:hypothetical protein